MIDLSDAYDELVRIIQNGSAQDNWRDVQNFLSRHASVEKLASVSIDEDIQSVRQQLISLLADEPPGFPLAALYFGLFDTVGEDGSEEIGFYLAGVEEFDPDDLDCLCNPAWWPENRYLRSKALAAIKTAELSAGDEDRSFIAYAGQLGAAIVVAKFASANLIPSAVRIVGFDSGDIAVLRQ